MSHLLRLILLIQRGLGHDINETWRALQAMLRCWEKTVGLWCRVTPFSPPPTCSVVKEVFEKKHGCVECVCVKRVCERERVMDSMHTKW